MPNIARSARGQEVDFDLLRIKQQMESAPKTATIQAREDFIDRRLKRKIRSQVENMYELQTTNTQQPIIPQDDSTDEEK